MPDPSQEEILYSVSSTPGELDTCAQVPGQAGCPVAVRHSSPICPEEHLAGREQRAECVSRGKVPEEKDPRRTQQPAPSPRGLSPRTCAHHPALSSPGTDCDTGSRHLGSSPGSAANSSETLGLRVPVGELTSTWTPLQAQSQVSYSVPGPRLCSVMAEGCPCGDTSAVPGSILLDLLEEVAPG